MMPLSYLCNYLFLKVTNNSKRCLKLLVLISENGTLSSKRNYDDSSVFMAQWNQKIQQVKSIWFDDGSCVSDCVFVWMCCYVGKTHTTTKGIEQDIFFLLVQVEKNFASLWITHLLLLRLVPKSLFYLFEKKERLLQTNDMHVWKPCWGRW